MILRLVYSITILFFLIINSALSNPTEANKYFKKGMENYTNGNFQSAIGDFINTLKIDPTHSGAKYFIKQSNKKIIKEQKREEKERKRKEKEKLKKERSKIEKLEGEKRNKEKEKEIAVEKELSKIEKIQEEKRNKEEERKTAVKKKEDEVERKRKKRLENAIDHYEKGELIIAREKIETILSFEPENLKATEYLKKTKDAINKMMRKRVEELFVEGQIYYDNKNYKDAIEVWEKVLKINPEHSITMERLWIARKRMEEEETGKEETKKEKDIKKYYEIGMKNYSGKRHAEAMTAFRKVLKLSPGNKKAKRYLALAGKNLKKRQKENKTKADNFYNLGLKEYQAGNFDMAINLWEETLKLYPGHSKADVLLKRVRKEKKIQ